MEEPTGVLRVPSDSEAQQPWDGDGHYVCRTCRGDWYACDCPRDPRDLSIIG